MIILVIGLFEYETPDGRWQRRSNEASNQAHWTSVVRKLTTRHGAYFEMTREINFGQEIILIFDLVFFIRKSVFCFLISLITYL